jgi:1-acyl-sn-glycerol-3-phosphate acyltransferase
VSAYVVARRILLVVFRLVWRPRVSGLEHIPDRGGVIIASNHLSFVDSVVIPLVVHRRVRFLAKAEYFEGGGPRGLLRRLFFTAIDAVPVRRASRRDSTASLEAALEVLRGGHAFGIYPEGTRSRDGRLYRGRTGVGWLALRSGAPIVPVALQGTDRVQPVGARIPRVHAVRVRFGPALDPAPWIRQVSAGGGSGRARREITDEVMDRIARMSSQVRAEGYNERAAEDAGPDE